MKTNRKKYNKNTLLAICRLSEAAGGARSNCVEFFGSFCRYKKNEEQQPYLFNGKELDNISGLNWYDFSARYYDDVLGRFTTPDPMAEMYYSISPYAAFGGNPLKYVDPSGMSLARNQLENGNEELGMGEDWVRNLVDDHYEWMDNVTSAGNTPEGYSYVGANDNDILTDMGVSSQYETKEDNGGSLGVVGGDSKGPLGEGAIGGSISPVSATITISPNVSIDPYNATENNKSGRTFNGVTVTAFVNDRTASSNDDINPTSGGYLSVINGNKEYKAGLHNPTRDYVYTVGTKITNASVQIPTSEISITSHLKSASVQIGYTNPGALYTKPIVIKWGLQIITMFRPIK